MNHQYYRGKTDSLLLFLSTQHISYIICVRDKPHVSRNEIFYACRIVCETRSLLVLGALRQHLLNFYRTIISFLYELRQLNKNLHIIGANLSVLLKKEALFHEFPTACFKEFLPHFQCMSCSQLGVHRPMNLSSSPLNQKLNLYPPVSMAPKRDGREDRPIALNQPSFPEKVFSKKEN